MLTAAFNLPFAEQADFFRGKLKLPTERWDDIKKSAHDRAFIVAGAQKADLLHDLQQAVQKAIDRGSGLEDFRKAFREIVQKHGWHGWTGEGTAAGEAWRTRVIFETNLLSSHAAGRYRQLTDPELLAQCPYWRYVHADFVTHPRVHHKAWGDARLTLRHDHPFWKTHYPPNGWGCRCRVVTVHAPGEGDATEAPEGWDAINPKTGAPFGIDKGWDYAPGASVAATFREIIDQKLINLEAPIGAALWERLKPVLAGEMRSAVSGMVDRVTAEFVRAKLANPENPRVIVGNEAVVTHVVSPATVADLAARDHPMQSADVWLREAEVFHALRDAKTGRGAALPEAVLRELPKYLENADPYLDTNDTALIYAFDLPQNMGKVAVNINYSEKIRSAGKRQRIKSNFVATGGIVEAFNMAESRYVPLKK